MPVTRVGWEMLVTREGLQEHRGQVRTYGAYQVYLSGAKVAALAGHICERSGPGDNADRGSHRRIKPGRYNLHTQFGRRYRTIGYSNDTNTPGALPMPGIDIDLRDRRDGILIHPGHPPDLYLSSTGCLNPTKLLAANEPMDFWESRDRVIALINSLHDFNSAAFTNGVSTSIAGAWIIVEGEPMDAVSSSMIASR